MIMRSVWAQSLGSDVKNVLGSAPFSGSISFQLGILFAMTHFQLMSSIEWIIGKSNINLFL